MAPSHEFRPSSPRANESELSEEGAMRLEIYSNKVYELAKESFFVEELRLQLPSTSVSEKHIMHREEKRATT